MEGYAYQALQGSENTLPDTKIVLLEVEFLPLYGDQHTFSDIDVYLRNNDFFLFNFYDITTHENGQIINADAIYLNEEYFDSL